MFPVFFNISFFIAGKNSSGSVISAPETPTVSSMYFLENSYKGSDLMVSQTILYPFYEIFLISSA